MTNNLQTQMENYGLSISKLNNGQNDHVATFKDIKHDLESLNSRIGDQNVVSDKKYDVLDQEIIGLRHNYTQGIDFLKSVNVSLEARGGASGDSRSRAPALTLCDPWHHPH